MEEPGWSISDDKGDKKYMYVSDSYSSNQDITKARFGRASAHEFGQC